jgi:hypothetical protein
METKAQGTAQASPARHHRGRLHHKDRFDALIDLNIIN